MTSAPLAIVCFSLLLAGCGSDDSVTLGEVTGTVTFDGQPLAKATVTFLPTDNVKESAGYTDKDGHYELGHKRGVKGAYVGKHRVRITTLNEEDWNERLPARYHQKTELTAAVESGVNKIDFDLTSKSK